MMSLRMLLLLAVLVGFVSASPLGTNLNDYDEELDDSEFDDSDSMSDNTERRRREASMVDYDYDYDDENSTEHSRVARHATDMDHHHHDEYEDEFYNSTDGQLMETSANSHNGTDYDDDEDDDDEFGDKVDGDATETQFFGLRLGPAGRPNNPNAL